MNPIYIESKDSVDYEIKCYVEVGEQMRRKEIIDKFKWGMSVLYAYVKFNNKLNMQDINVYAETFMCDLINILYDLNLKNSNNSITNSPGYDLISKDKKVVVQVTATDTASKLIHTFEVLGQTMREYANWENMLEKILEDKEKNIHSYTEEIKENEERLRAKIKEHVNLKGYNIYFVVLTDDAGKQKQYLGKDKNGYKVPEGLVFDASKHILDFTNLVNEVNSLSELTDENEVDKLEKLEQFMLKNRNIFFRREDIVTSKNKVDSIIKEYADNFSEKLFRHRYIENTEVKLCNVFVNPEIEINGIKTRNYVNVLDEFLWGNPNNRILFIDGDAAIGKTSFVSCLCYHYLKLTETGKAIFLDKKLVCIRLRELEFSDKSCTVQDAILKYLGITSLDDFFGQYGNCVIILDGADEMSMIEGIQSAGMEEVIATIRKIFKNNKLIITSRPKFISLHKFQSQVYNVVTAKLLHFNAAMRCEWINKYEACGEIIPQNTKEYIENMDDYTASGVADTPLALYLLVACDMEKNLQGNIWALYNEIFRNAIINAEYNENFSNESEHPIKYHEEIIFKTICGIAFKMFQNAREERYYITSEELDEIIEGMSLDNRLKEWVKKCCVLCAYWKAGTNIGVLEFYHNNIRDYFFCEYICSEIAKLKKNHVFVSAQEILKLMCDILSHARISGTTWEQTFSFIALRLKYEKENDNTNSDCSDTQFEKELTNICNKMLVSDDTIWTYKYNFCNYQNIKNTIYNILLLVQIYQQLNEAVPLNYTRFWESEEEFLKVNSMKILAEWCEMFLGTIRISSDKILSGGNSCYLDKIDFQNISLHGVDFSKSSLRESLFCGAKLQNASFRQCLLHKANFESANLEYVDFRGADLSFVDFTKANLTGANFEGAKVINADFAGAVLKDVNFTGAILQNINLKSQNLQGVCLKNTTFLECELSRSKLKKVSIENVLFENCHFVKANLENCITNKATFINCLLDSAIFSSSCINESIFENVHGNKTNFANTKIRKAEFSTSVFTEAIFTQSMIEGNSWHDINLDRADFRRAKILINDKNQLMKNNADLKWISETEMIIE